MNKKSACSKGEKGAKGMHELMKVAEVRRHMSAIKEHDVSRVARDPGGFLHEYLRVGPSMLDEIAPGGRITRGQRRTERRRLALVAWAYDPC